MAWAIGDTVTVSVVFLNPDGTGATGLAGSIATPIKRVRSGAGATPSFPTLSSWSHVGSGYYEATFVAATAGEHTVIADAGSPYLPYEWKGEVITAAEANPADPEAVAATIMAQAVGGASGTFGAALQRLLAPELTEIYVPTPLAADQTLTVVVGHTYAAAEGDAIDFPNAGWAAYDLEEVGVGVWFVALRSGLVLRKDMEVVDTTTVRLELTGAETVRLRSAGSYRVYASLPGQSDPVTLVQGKLSMQSG